VVRKKLKKAFCLVMVLYFSFLTLFGVGDYLYPDTVHCPKGEEPECGLVFSLKEPEDAVFSPLEETSLKEYRLMAFGVIPLKRVSVYSYPKGQVVCGGELIGIRLRCKGLLVQSLGNVVTVKGESSPGLDAGLQVGDLLLRCDGVPLESASDLTKLIAKSKGKGLKLEFERNRKPLQTELFPASASDGSGWKAGIWVRDGAAGIGTVTFADPATGVFYGLGHAICDGESKIPFPLAGGSIYKATVESVVKGTSGKAGEIRGHLESNVLGSLLANTEQGIRGMFQTPVSSSQTYPLGKKEDLKKGKASIWCTLQNGGKKEYEIEIEEIVGKERDSKNFILRVTDPELLKQTGGIVQGMSGSPIIQDGKLVGAVTHVLVDDPTRGYGIFIENMLDAANTVSKEQQTKKDAS